MKRQSSLGKSLLVAVLFGSMALTGDGGKVVTLFQDDFENPEFAVANFQLGFERDQDVVWSVGTLENFVSTRTFDFDTEQTGLGDRGLVRIYPGVEIVESGGTNVLALAGDVYGDLGFQLPLDKISFQAISSSTFTAMAYNFAQEVIDQENIESTGMVELKGPRISFVKFWNVNGDAAIDDLTLDFSSSVVPADRENQVLIGDEMPHDTLQSVGLLDKGHVYLRDDLTLSFDMKLLGPDYAYYADVDDGGALWLAKKGNGDDPLRPATDAKAGVGFSLNPETQLLVFWQKYQGALTPLVTTPLPEGFNLLAWHHFDVTQRGQTSTVTMDAMVQVTADIPADLLEGQVGFFNDEAAAYDNVFLSGQRIITDVNTDGGTNAVDVQIVINGALGINPPSGSADVNGDTTVDAVDVQYVINGALGLV
ncbi:MAG: hypothetical protein HY706_01465 [Candidatus Hydrogenedentes bacterium]|nr:hypothetical protein [Candidatus Hydrogenedentota bacterium]